MTINQDSLMSKAIARTGRVQNWIDDPSGRLPVSCTVFECSDSMVGKDGIEASWNFVSHGLRYGAGVAVHLSKLRGRGVENGKGLCASGPVSFGKIYSCLNEQLRRGGIYKNGAVVLHLDINHPDIIEFVETPREQLPWAKRCVNLTQLLWEEATQEVKDAIILGIARGDVWLAKIRHDQFGKRIFANVCLEVFLKSRGTCLLQHVALGACEVNEIADAFKEGMQELCQLHPNTGVGETGYYLPPTHDRQVGLGMLGLANLLALENVTYAQFGDALTFHLYPHGEYLVTPEALKIVKELQRGIDAAADIARSHNMDRAFAIAPTASCSYRYKDRAGYTTAPEIAPPIGRSVDRDSSTFGVEQFNYGNVETCEDVGWETYTRVVNGIVEMLNRTGLNHGYSFNTWSDVVTYDENLIETWLRSPQTSMYYSLQVMQNTQTKDDAMAALDGDFSAIFNFDDIDAEDNSSEQTRDEPDFCVSCAE